MMSVSVSSRSMARNNDPSCWESNLDKMVIVTVVSTGVLNFGWAHHFIKCDEVGNGFEDKMFRIAEWSNKGLDYYAVSKDSFSRRGSHFCLSLGEYRLRSVFIAIQIASNGREYKIFRYNCNHWTENVAYYLGYKITVHWNCCCR